MCAFSSDKHHEILTLESRRKIYALVKQYSGCNFHELERKSNTPATTLQYHLHYLAKEKLISTQKDGNKIRYFSNTFSSKDKYLLALLRQRHIRHILLFLLDKERQQHEVAQFLGLSPSTVSWHLSKLVQQKIITLVRKKETYYRLAIPSTDIIPLLITYQESFFDTLVDKTIDMWNFR